MRAAWRARAAHAAARPGHLRWRRRRGAPRGCRRDVCVRAQRVRPRDARRIGRDARQPRARRARQGEGVEQRRCARARRCREYQPRARRAARARGGPRAVEQARAELRARCPRSGATSSRRASPPTSCSASLDRWRTSRRACCRSASLWASPATGSTVGARQLLPAHAGAVDRRPDVDGQDQSLPVAPVQARHRHARAAKSERPATRVR